MKSIVRQCLGQAEGELDCLVGKVVRPFAADRCAPTNFRAFSSISRGRRAKTSRHLHIFLQSFTVVGF